MYEGDARTGRPTTWLRPRVESQGAVRYLATIRERWWLIALATAIAVAVAGLYVVLAPERYESEVDVLVTPVSSDDPTTAGLGLITESNDPTQVVSTAARLVATQVVAEAVKEQLGTTASARSLLADVTAEPIAQSSLIAVRASSSSATSAARLANAFATAAIAVRTEQLHAEIERQLEQLELRIAALPVGSQSERETLALRSAGLRTLASAPDPTLRVATPADVPRSPVSPRTKLALAAGLLGGLILGLGAAFASQALDPRLQREDQLRDLFRLPVLTRIPRLPDTRNAGPLPPSRLTPAATEAYRTLRATLAASVGENHRSVLVTSSSPGEGKTTTAINFADALAVAGHRVILIEGDLRRPTMARALGIQPVVGIGAVLVNHASLEKAIVTTPQYGPNLGFLLVEHSAASLADRLSLPTARQLVAEAEANADFVVIDSPPLTEVVDALPLAQEVDAVVIMARMGTSRLNRLTELGETLAHGGVQPAGMVVIGRDHAAQAAYHTGRDLPRARAS